MFDVRFRKICLRCGYHTFNKDEALCPACKNQLEELSFWEGRKIINLGGDERFQYIEQKLIGHPVSQEYNQLREAYYKMKRDDFQQQKREQRRQREATNLAYMNKYFEFVHEAEAQGIPKSEAENIASYAMQHGMPSLPKCPTCGSVDVSKISAGTKVAKTAAFGVFGAMSDAGKSWKCRKCGCKW